MVTRHERNQQSLKQEVEKKSDNVLTIASIAGLLGALGIKAYEPTAVPDFVLWGLLASISKDVLKLVRIDKR